MWRIIGANAQATATTRGAALAAALLMAATEALAQETQAGRGKSAAPGAGAASQPEERRIVVSIPDRKLALVVNGQVTKIYPVAVGATGSPSPGGEFKIAHRIPQPTYYAPGQVIPPGNDNPLGTRWIGLGMRGYGIHGTNAPGSIGRKASHGCIRMRNRDVEDLFERVRIGDVVELHAERDAVIAQVFGGTPVPAMGTVLATVASAAPAPVAAAPPTGGQK